MRDIQTPVPRNWFVHNRVFVPWLGLLCVIFIRRSSWAALDANIWSMSWLLTLTWLWSVFCIAGRKTHPWWLLPLVSTVAPVRAHVPCLVPLCGFPDPAGLLKSMVCLMTPSIAIIELVAGRADRTVRITMIWQREFGICPSKVLGCRNPEHVTNATTEFRSHTCIGFQMLLLTPPTIPD